MIHLWLFDLAVLISVLMHEFGHVLACWLSKTAIKKVTIGYGNVIVNVKKLEIRLVPIAGKVELLNDASSPFKGVFIALSGFFFQFFLVFLLVVTHVARSNVELFSYLIIVTLLQSYVLLPIGKNDGRVALVYALDFYRKLQGTK